MKITLLLPLMLAAATLAPAQERLPYNPNPSGFTIRRGVNLSHWLSQCFGWSPRATFITEDDIRFIASVGYDHVRIPIDEKELWTEDGRPVEESFAYLTRALDWSAKHKLRAIVDLHIVRAHHFNAANEGGTNTLWTDPKAQAGFLRLWEELSRRLKHYPVDQVAYEIMNEAVAEDHEDWNRLLASAVASIRSREPKRVLVIGSNMWQIPRTFPFLKVPEKDPNVILSVHTYVPLIFTHYKASWMPLQTYTGAVHYPGAPLTQEALDGYADRNVPAVAQWLSDARDPYGPERLFRELEPAISRAKALNLQLYLGEFGCLPTVPREDRLAYYRDLVGVVEKHGLAWANWDYKGDFGIMGFDREKQVTLQPDADLIKALLGRQASVPSFPAGAAALDNPLLAPWSGPYGGVPPFERVKVEQFQPALEAAMAEALGEIERIATDPAPPTFQNTIAAMEATGRTLDRASNIFGIYSSALSTPEFQKVEQDMAPKLAAFFDRITQNEKLFKRIAAAYEAREGAGLTPEQKRLAWLDYTNFVRAGARLDAGAKKRLSEINQRLATLFTKFSQNLLADETDYVLFLDKDDDLTGLPAPLRAAAAASAKERGQEGKWAILNTRSSMEPFLTYSARRDLREKVWRTYYSRGDHDDAKDNKALITEILKLRAERARLLGYQTHAHWRMENSMAHTPERAVELLEAVWRPAVARVREEVADMQALADREGAKIKIEPWDYRYYAEKVRKAKYDLDQNEVKPYLQLEKLREAMFWVAGQLFGFQFTPVTDVPVYNPDMRVYRVSDAAGQLVGLWYFDPYARTGKQSGAWMNAYRNQERFERPITTIVSNNANFVKGQPGEPILISWDDAETLFHEFGHALHGLCSNVSYPALSGTSVARDYVEFPSQILEHWLSTPEVLNRFALHFETGKPIPAELVRKIEKARTFNQGFATVEYLASALIDMKLHLAGEQTIDPRAFEKDTLTALGMPSEIVMRHRTPQFAHIFSSDSYSAGYYSYLWADTLSTDAWEAFSEAGGAYDKGLAHRLYDNVFSRGNTIDPAEAYRAFRGRDPGIGALMRDRGFPVPANTETRQ
jgi:peptidyl-dipeptidase Dcp